MANEYTLKATIILNSAAGWNYPMTHFFLERDTGKCYTTYTGEKEINAIEIPTHEQYQFNGYLGPNYDTWWAIDSSGVIQERLRQQSYGSAQVSLKLQYTVISYKSTFDKQGGTGGTDYLFEKKNTRTWFIDGHCKSQTTKIVPPVKNGYVFAGYYNGTTTLGSRYVDSVGNLDAFATTTLTSNKTVYAKWNTPDYTVVFHANNGSGTMSNQGMCINTPSLLNDCTYTKQYYHCIGWSTTPNGGLVYKNGAEVLNLTQTSGATVNLYAVWQRNFGNVTDFFNLENDKLIAFESENGSNHMHNVVYNGTIEVAATQTTGIWLNPTVSYNVVGDTTLSITLGKAFPSDDTSNKTGYMIDSVQIQTGLGIAPIVTVTGVANEGVDAIQLYNLEIPISYRHRPQNLLGSISGGGELQALVLDAQADPVVIVENGMPCASDICHGRIIIKAKTCAFDFEDAPNASSGFIRTAEPKSENGTEYRYWGVEVRKELN